MSEKDNEKYVFSYMDGIPVKISEKYKPPRKVVLPVGFQNRLLQLPVSANYDFALEENVVEKLQQWRELRLKEKEKRKERIATEDAKVEEKRNETRELQERTQELSVEDEVSSPKQSTPTPPASLTPPSCTTLAQPALLIQSSVCHPVISETNPILRPIPIKHQVVTSQINNNKPLSAFNLSDFEADTSSPFDNMELKTINDLEELAQVLQPPITSQASGYYQNTVPTSQMFAAMHQNVNQNQPLNPSLHIKMLNDSKSTTNYPTHINGVASNYSVYNPNSAYQVVDCYGYNPQSVIAPTSICEQAVSCNFMDREQVLQATSTPFPYTSNEPQRKVQNLLSNSMWSTSGNWEVSRNESSSQGYKLNTPEDCRASSNRVHSSSSTSPPPEVSSAVGNIVQELSQFMKSRSFKPSQNAFNQPSSNETSSKEVPGSCLPDPFTTLHPDIQSLAQKITEMGFPFARVARACQVLGSNDKKVVESLLSLQSLLDAGYTEDRAERALSLNDYDVVVANRFLLAETQLLDLGFPNERVSEALLKCNCDIDKALDFLIS